MGKEEFIEIVMNHSLLTREDVAFGIEFFKKDAETDAEEIVAYSHFTLMLLSIYDTDYQYDIHQLNMMYLKQIDSCSNDPEQNKRYSMLIFSEITYFCEFESYSEALTLIDKAIDMGGRFYPGYLAAALIYLYMIHSSCGVYDDLPEIIERMENILAGGADIGAYEYFVFLILMEAHGILGNSERSDYYYDKCLKYPADNAYIENTEFNADLSHLWLVARNKPDATPDSDYLALFRKSMNNIGCDCEILNLHTYLITVFDYVRGSIPEEELKKYLIHLIELIAAPRTKIELYEYLFSAFNYDKKSNPKFCEPYYIALAAHFRMSMDMQKRELTGILNKRKELNEYRNHSEMDELTGLGNRRAFDELQKVYTNARDIPDNLYIASMDLNGLKDVNDKFGHMAGDAYICAAAENIKNGLEGYGTAFRTGGDEFIAVLHTDASGVENAISRIKERNLTWSQSRNQDLVISFGYACPMDIAAAASADSAPATAETIFSALMALSDERMYADKKAYYARIGYNRRHQ